MNTSLYLTESFKYETYICVETRKERIDSEKFQNHWLNITYTNIHVHISQGINCQTKQIQSNPKYPKCLFS